MITQYNVNNFLYNKNQSTFRNKINLIFIYEIYKQHCAHHVSIIMNGIVIIANEHARKVQQEKQRQEKEQRERPPIVHFEREQPTIDSTKLIQNHKKPSSPSKNLNIICKQSTLLTLESKLDSEKKKQTKNGFQNSKIKSSKCKLQQEQETKDNDDKQHKKNEKSDRHKKIKDKNHSSKQSSYDQKPPTGRKIVNPEKPKSPSTAFLRFNKDNIDKVRNQHPNLTQNQLVTVTGMLWKKLTAQEKEPYEQAYEKDKIKYHAQMKIFYKKYPLEKTKKFLKEQEKMMDN